MGDIQENSPVGSWVVGTSDTLKFPIERISETGGNRIVERERPYRPGAKLDDTDAKATRWSVTIRCNNSTDEQDLDPNVPGYPDLADKLIETFKQHLTGDLSLPTRATVRARAATWQRDESIEAQDECMLVLTWVEDNEDRIGAQSIQRPTVRSSAQQNVQDAVFSAEGNGISGLSIEDLTQFASEIEGIVNFPENFASDVQAVIGRVDRAVDSILGSFQKVSTEGRDLLMDPEASTTLRLLHGVKDQIHQALGEKFSRLKQIVPIAYPRPMSIFAIANDLKQDAEDLIDINAQLEDVMAIPANQTVRVFAQ